MTRILLVDDLFENQEILAEIMTGFGFEYATAGSVQSAVHQATGQDFDAVIMDLGIPFEENGPLNVMGGLEASRLILAHPHSKDLPIVAFTNRRVKDVERAVLDAGLRAVLEKGPRMEERLLRILQELLNLPAASQHTAADSDQSTHQSLAVAQPGTKRNTSSEQASGNATLTTVCIETEEQVTLTIQATQTVSLESNAAEPMASATLPELHANMVMTNPTMHLVDSFLELLATARSQAEQLTQEVAELEVDTNITRLLGKLQKQLDKANASLNDPSAGPVAGEPFGHWVGSLILGAHRSCKALESSDHENFEKFSQTITGILDTLESMYVLSRTDAAQIVTHPQPAVTPASAAVTMLATPPAPLSNDPSPQADVTLDLNRQNRCSNRAPFPRH